jgi:hypothetical protein
MKKILTLLAALLAVIVTVAGDVTVTVDGETQNEEVRILYRSVSSTLIRTFPGRALSYLL